jgi:uracil-DNA glycosylase
MESLLAEIKNCRVCEQFLSDGPRPVVTAHPQSKIAIIGQAPGLKVHQSGIPWDDASGKKLREWLGVGPEQFYDERLIALVPMGFCYPGKGRSGDLPPRPECAPQWHDALLKKIPDLKLVLLIGTYAQKYYLGEASRKNLTDTVRAYKEYLPPYFPLPHPSPRNRFWLTKNPWFESEVLPDLKLKIEDILKL